MNASPRPFCVRRALTFVELLAALAGTALIGAALAAMMFALARGTEADQDLRSLVGRRTALAARHAAAIRAAHRVLAQAPAAIVLWRGDANASGTPDLSEIRRIDFDGLDQVASYRAPSGLAPAGDTAYVLTDDFLAITAALKGTANWPATLWARGVTAWTTSLDQSDPQQASLVSYRARLQAGGREESLCGAVMLRN